nr:hypothetical protein [Tanacetum cinerariifolium]
MILRLFSDLLCSFIRLLVNLVVWGFTCMPKTEFRRFVGVLGGYIVKAVTGFGSLAFALRALAFSLRMSTVQGSIVFEGGRFELGSDGVSGEGYWVVVERQEKRGSGVVSGGRKNGRIEMEKRNIPEKSVLSIDYHRAFSKRLESFKAL